VSNKETIAGTVQIEGLQATIKAFNKLDKEGKDEARKTTQSIADRLAGYIRSGAPAGVRYANLAVSVKSGRDRVPVIRIGGRQTPRVSGGAGPAQLVIGMEFGADQAGPNSWRFPPRTPRKGRGNEGYWIYKTAASKQPEISKMWFAAMDKVIAKWSD